MIETHFGRLTGQTDSDLKTGDAAVAVIRPQAVQLIDASGDASQENRLSARIKAMNFLGDVIETDVMCGDQKVVLMLSPYAKSGQDVTVNAEYLGRSNEAGSPCATSGAVGSTTSVGPMVPALVQ